MLAAIEANGAVTRREPIGDGLVSCLATSCDGYDLQVAVNPAGDGAVVWVDSDGRVAARLVRAGAPAELVPVSESAGRVAAQSLRAVVDAQGAVTVLWAEDDAAANVTRLTARRLAAGAIAGDSVTVEQATDTAYRAELAADAAGNVTVAWLAWGRDAAVRMRRWSASGALETTRALTSRAGALGGLALTPSGTGAIVYAVNSRLIGRRISATGALGRRTTLARQADANSTTYGPQVQIDAQGDATVVWNGAGPGAKTALNVRTFSQRATLGRTYRARSEFDPMAVRLATAPDGRGLIGWTDDARNGHLRLIPLSQRGKPGKRVSRKLDGATSPPDIAIGSQRTTVIVQTRRNLFVTHSR